MILTRELAEKALEEANASNPGPWSDHSRYVALACQNIASCCPDMDEDIAYIYGILHDIGRYAGVSSEKHLIDGTKRDIQLLNNKRKRILEQFEKCKTSNKIYDIEKLNGMLCALSLKKTKAIYKQK